MKKLVFLCSARDFHAMDWYKSAKKNVPNNDLCIVTDQITGEGYDKLIGEFDKIHQLIILDNFLFKHQSELGNKWRNILKFLLLPFQAFLLKQFNNRYENCIYHAHSMYYLVLARLANVEYIGTPQGSDILIKPYKSILYKRFAIFGLQKAKHITVDSMQMQHKIYSLAKRESIIIQNGIDLSSLNSYITLLKNQDKQHKRSGILSIRGYTPLYRIKNIVESRNNQVINEPLIMTYPFEDSIYKNECKLKLKENDSDLGTIRKSQLYSVMYNAKLVISIPKSDSSPKSVYESIFCGAPVAITYNQYYDILPNCMKKRIIIVDINQSDWLYNALKKADDIIKVDYHPSQEALVMFDQLESSKKILKLILE